MRHARTDDDDDVDECPPIHHVGMQRRCRVRICFTHRRLGIVVLCTHSHSSLWMHRRRQVWRLVRVCFMCESSHGKAARMCTQNINIRMRMRAHTLIYFYCELLRAVVAVGGECVDSLLRMSFAWQSPVAVSTDAAIHTRTHTHTHIEFEFIRAHVARGELQALE